MGCSLSLVTKMEAARFSETSVNIYQSMRRNVPEIECWMPSWIHGSSPRGFYSTWVKTSTICTPKIVENSEYSLIFFNEEWRYFHEKVLSFEPLLVAGTTVELANEKFLTSWCLTVCTFCMRCTYDTAILANTSQITHLQSCIYSPGNSIQLWINCRADVHSVCTVF